MAMAYTPGLKRKGFYVIRKIRRLPILGEVLVKKGDSVSYDTIVAKASVPGKVETLNAGPFLGVEPDRTKVLDLSKYMLKKEGDLVEKDEIVARNRYFFGLVDKICRAPVKGTVEVISKTTGQILFRLPPVPLVINAYIPGTVVDVHPNEGATIETSGAYIQGIFGVGGETHGELMVIAKSYDDVLTSDQIGPECKGKVLVGGSLVEAAALHRAVEVGVKGIIVGGIEDKDLTDLLGYSIGVAITGNEQAGLTLVATEGFGKMSMARRTLDLLKKFDGWLTCINGVTQIRAGTIRPEIIIPREVENLEVHDEKELLMEGLRPGLPVRIISEPYFGALGHVVSLPVDLKRVQTESYVRVLEVEMDDGKRVIVPRANVELIEE